MKLLASIHPEDVDPSSPRFDYTSFKTRPAGRAIIFDGNKICLIHVSTHDYYMLPGGGIENEDLRSALTREIMEEVGCEIEVDHEVGRIELFFDHWKQKQVDYCYTAFKIGEDKTASMTDFEESEGFKVVWVENLAEAIKLVEGATPKEGDGKLVQARDLLFLQTVATR